MSLVALNMPYFPDPSIGRPVVFGSIYVGEPDLDPEIVANQKTISIRQEDGTEVPVSQPVLTGAGGVPMYAGSPVQILVDGDYSLKVLNQSGTQVYYIDSAVNLNPSSVLNIFGAYDTIADLRNAAIYTNANAYVKGYSTVGDGGHGNFLWDSSDLSTEVAADTQSSIYVAPTSDLTGASGAWVLQRRTYHIAPEAPPDSSFAPNEKKYLFMDPAEYEAYNTAPAVKAANHFHYFGTGDDIRVEFEAATGAMQFYIESGVGQSAWYGWQEGATHHYSMGTDPHSDYDLKLCAGFGVQDKFAHFIVRGPTSGVEGQVQIKQDVAGIAPLAVRTSDILGAVGLLVEVGQATSSYLADFRLADGTQQVRVTGSGHVLTRLGTATSPAFSFIGNDDTGIFNPGANAVSFAVAGTEAMRLNGNRTLLLNTTSGGGGVGVIAIANTVTAPTSNFSGGTIFVESGALKYRGSNGTITVIGAA